LSYLYADVVGYLPTGGSKWKATLSMKHVINDFYSIFQIYSYIWY